MRRPVCHLLRTSNGAGCRERQGGHGVCSSPHPRLRPVLHPHRAPAPRARGGQSPKLRELRCRAGGTRMPSPRCVPRLLRGLQGAVGRGPQAWGRGLSEVVGFQSLPSPLVQVHGDVPSQRTGGPGTALKHPRLQGPAVPRGGLRKPDLGRPRTETQPRSSKVRPG